MTTPPPGWQPNQQPGPVPPRQGGSYGQQASFNPQQPPPPSWQQGPWQQPPQKGNNVKWLLIAVAVLLVIAISIGGTLLFTRDGGGSGETPSTSSRPTTGTASAADTAPVAVITEEPTCRSLNNINSALADVQANGWSAQRASLGRSSEWTPEQKRQVDAVTTAMTNAAEQMVTLAKQTPHRVVRELYEQFIAYARAYTDSIPTYLPEDNELATTNVSIGSAMLGLCNAIEYGSASRSLALETARSPTGIGQFDNPAHPERFVVSSSPTCSAWIQREDQFITDTAEWAALDTKVSAAQWTPEQRSIQLGALPILTRMADENESAARASTNPILEDFGVLSSLYLRAYVSAGDKYNGVDSWLSYTSARLNNTITSACRAVKS